MQIRREYWGSAVVLGVVLSLAACGSTPADGEEGFDAAVTSEEFGSGEQAVCEPGPYGSGYLGNWLLLSHRGSSVEQCTTAYQSPLGVYAIGDSITNQTFSTLTSKLVADGRPPCINAWSGRPTRPGVDWLQAQNGRLPKTLLIAKGTNDIFDPSVMAAQAKRALALAGSGRKVYWVNVYAKRAVSGGCYATADLRNSALINQTLRSVRNTYSGTPGYAQMVIIDWYAFLTASSSRPGLYLSDGVHLTTAGVAARNELISWYMRNY